MNTPIFDFVERYQSQQTTRFHMPGHKGTSFLGCEQLDITEVKGADALYEAEGIIAESERNAAALFGSQRTCFSAEGSSQCIRAMLYLALTNRPDGAAPTIVAARNVHKAFVYTASLLGFDVVWLWPEENRSLCSCPVSAEQLDAALSSLPAPPAAVYLTSPDYLGGIADIPSLAEVCHRHGTILAVDNAHGAYLHFLSPAMHPLDLGADICCDSAHKTLPVLTGGAYLHISKSAPAAFAQHAKTALALFGSTSPSYLILSSLDRCNRYLAEECRSQMAQTVRQMDAVRQTLSELHWQVEPSDPLRLTICAPEGLTGVDLAERLREHNIECEHADDAFLVLMMTPQNTAEELARLPQALGKNDLSPAKPEPMPVARCEQVMDIRSAMFARHETLPVSQALGRISGTPTVSCPPAIPIVVPGERIDETAVQLFHYYGMDIIDVLK